MDDQEREHVSAWLREHAWVYPDFAPANVDVSALVALWATRFRRPEALCDPAHPVWELARAVARDTPPLVPWTPAQEALIAERSRLESRILHDRATPDEVARYWVLCASPKKVPEGARADSLGAALGQLLRAALFGRR